MPHIITQRKLHDFWEQYPDAETHLRTWYAIAKAAEWKNSNEVKAVFRSASVVGNNRIVFNIRGNHYRLIVKFHFNRNKAYIRFIGTHAEYDRINARTI